MKSKKNKLTNLLKTGILFFTISLLFWNCNDESINEFNENVAVAQVSNFQPIEIDEAKSFMNNLISKNKKQLRKGGFSVTIEENSLNFKEVKKTNLTVPTFSASVKPNISSKVFMVKKQDSIYTCLYNYIPFENEDSSLDVLSGKIIISTIDGAFINGYKVLDGVFVSQYKQKTESETASKTFRKDAEPDDDYWWDLGSLDEISITSTGAGGGGYIFIYSNPVSSQGWMNLNLSGNTSSGGGGSSNGGNGGNSNSGEMPLFPCDNPTPNGCEEEEEEQIINELTGKDKCVYNKLKDLNLFKSTIKKFENSSSYNLTIESGNCQNTNTACTDGSIINSGNITITMEIVSGALPLEYAATLLHEGVHAELFKYVDEHQKGIDPNNRENLLYHYFEQKKIQKPSLVNSVAQHQHMADKYVKPIAEAIRKLDNNQYPLEYYMGFGWDGLRTYGYDGYYDNGQWVNLNKDQSTEYYKKQKIVNDNTKLKGNECK